MDFLSTLFDMLAAVIKAVWPGVLGAALGAYLGISWLGFTGYLIGAAGGALLGTWAGDRLGLLKVKAMTGTANGDLVAYAAGALAIVMAFYFLWQFIWIIAAIAAVAVLAGFFLNG